ncbi:MAG TPA: hypothetical protein VH599_18880 [Ktedonobacterales bacterium]|jgi:hypothetical protein
MSEIEDAYDGAEGDTRGETIQRSSDVPADGVSKRQFAEQRRKVANPDDWPVHQPPRGPRGPLPGPRESGSPGRVAIVQGQVFIVGLILIAQLWLVTDALYEFLSGRTERLGWLALASGIGFVIALIVWLWPRQRVKGR